MMMMIMINNDFRAIKIIRETGNNVRLLVGRCEEVAVKMKSNSC